MSGLRLACGASPTAPWAALAALERQLQRLEAAQAIGPDVAARLNAAIGEARRELSTPRADRLPLEVTAQTDAPAESPVSVAAEFETPEAVPAEIVVPELPRKVEPTRGADPAEAVPLAAAQSGSGEIARQLEDRVRQFVEQRNSLALEPAARDSATPRRPWSDVLAGFMEEKNIRWGELVGGLLIVCCSIALVISFRAKIAERPFLKFFVFGGVTAALFAVGFYTERRWKLQTTSRGLLVIATLLVPLNFLAIAALDHPSAAPGSVRSRRSALGRAVCRSGRGGRTDSDTAGRDRPGRRRDGSGGDATGRAAAR